MDDSAWATTIWLSVANTGLFTSGEEEITAARLELLELVLEAMEEGVLTADEARPSLSTTAPGHRSTLMPRRPHAPARTPTGVAAVGLWPA
ncbi:hypothetical protein [Streptomyces sp. NPDC048196]|uniref:hypothetical protein n=1 Tax=Streptomyces sp. NPDC048196 TaxID=3154712 RepID=UPI0033E6B9CC